MMLSCWNIDPLERPSFETVRNTLENILHESEDYLELEVENKEWNYGNRNYCEDINEENSLQQKYFK